MGPQWYLKEVKFSFKKVTEAIQCRKKFLKNRKLWYVVYPLRNMTSKNSTEVPKRVGFNINESLSSEKYKTKIKSLKGAFKIMKVANQKASRRPHGRGKGEDIFQEILDILFTNIGLQWTPLNSASNMRKNLAQLSGAQLRGSFNMGPCLTRPQICRRIWPN